MRLEQVLSIFKRDRASHLLKEKGEEEKNPYNLNSLLFFPGKSWGRRAITTDMITLWW